jgi:hypothetical protein
MSSSVMDGRENGRNSLRTLEPLLCVSHGAGGGVHESGSRAGISQFEKSQTGLMTHSLNFGKLR